MSPVLSWGILAGLGLGLGLWLIVSRLPRLRGPRLAERVVPFIVDVSEPARDVATRRGVDPLPLLGFTLTPFASLARAASATLLGGGDDVARFLRQAGDATGIERFRLRRLGWSLAGLAAGSVLVVVVPTLRSAAAVVQFALPLVSATCVFLCAEQLLRMRARSRLRRVSEELPTALEFLALSLAAGESLRDALRRVAHVGQGELAREFGIVLAEAGTGVPLATALRTLASALRLPELSRAIEALVAAMERGTPLADVLLAQAQDTREAAKRALIELAGKKELAMLVPLVFLILPVTVLFAVYPGVFVLNVGFGG